MRILIIIATWLGLVWSLYAAHYEFRPVYEVPDYEDFALQEDSYPSSLISWLDNNPLSRNTGKRQRITQEYTPRPSSGQVCIFACVPVIFLHNSITALWALLVQHLGCSCVKIFIQICCLRL
ncbi:MAG: hypothetical protein RMJ87_00750 [Cytophagales bacterium]|nr:hypothetical protein [Bernardetiaceae bacterium]MDW8203528.1 hypothetical protein [Cytophagales bacterium]